MRHVLACGALVALLAGAQALAQSSPVVGAWTIAVETPQGPIETTITFAEAAGGYSASLATAEIPGFEPPPEEITDVVIDGESFSFRRTIAMPQGPIEITYTGTVDGDALTGQASTAAGGVAITGMRN